MKHLTIAAIFVFIHTPALACHHYTYWRFKTPQRCYNAPVHHPPPAAPKDASWYVEVIMTDEIGRNIAIDKLREMMKK